MVRLFQYLIAFLFFTLISLGCLEEDKKEEESSFVGFRIYGIVYNHDESAVLEGASISLTMSGEGAPTYEPVTSNDEGAYEFSGLVAGDYTVEVSLAGYVTYNEAMSLSSGDIDVSLHLSEVSGSDSGDDDGGDSGANSADPIVFEASFSTLNRMNHIADEGAASFTHNGDSVLCSSNGGSSYGACSSSTRFEWSAANYNNEHKIKVSKSGVSDHIYSFTPSAMYPSQNFYDCDVEISENESFATFVGRLNIEDDYVVCLSDGVEISLGSGDSSPYQGTIGYNNYVIIAREGDTATIDSDSFQSSVRLFDLGSKSGFKLVGIRTNIYRGKVVYADATTSVVVEDVWSNLESTSGAEYMYEIRSSSTISFNNVELYTHGSNATTIDCDGGSTCDIYNSIVVGGSNAIATYSGAFNVYSSTLSLSTISGAGGNTVWSQFGDILLSDSTIEVTRGDAMHVRRDSDLIVFDGATIKMMEANPSPGIVINIDGSYNPTVNVSSGGVVICDVNSSAAAFSGVTNGTVDGASTFDPGSYTINACP